MKALIQAYIMTYYICFSQSDVAFLARPVAEQLKVLLADQPMQISMKHNEAIKDS
jgi:hypothetical protein